MNQEVEKQKRKRIVKDPNTKPRPRNQALKDVRIGTDVTSVEYAGMCKDIYEYFKKIHECKPINSTEINALLLKGQMICWRLSNDYTQTILYEKVKETDVIDVSDTEKKSIDSDFLNDF